MPPGDMQMITLWFVGEALKLDSIAIAQSGTNLRCPALALFIRDVVASEVERTVGVVRGSGHMLIAVVARGDNRRRQTKCARLVRDHAQCRHQSAIHTAEVSARLNRPQYIIGTQIHGRKLRSLPPRCYVGFGVVWRPSALELKWMVADNR